MAQSLRQIFLLWVKARLLYYQGPPSKPSVGCVHELYDFSELSHMIVEPGKSKICRTGRLKTQGRADVGAWSLKAVCRLVELLLP